MKAKGSLYSPKSYVRKKVSETLYYWEHYHQEDVFVLAFIREQIVWLTNSNRLGTAQNYTRLLSSFSDFLGGSDVLFSALNARMVEEYSIYLERRRVVRNTVSFYMRILRSVYNKAVRQKITIQEFPFSNVYTGIDYTRKRAINEQMISRLAQLNLSDSTALSFARDLFVFSYCARGMSFVDMAYLRKKDLQSGIIYYTRRKTGQLLAIQLEPCMREIVKRYASGRRNSPYVFPILTSEETARSYVEYQTGLNYYNRLLKKLSQRLRIDNPISSYTARHSWATAARNHNIPLSVITAGMGHTSERTTQIYLAMIENSVIDSANKVVVDSIQYVAG